MQEYAKFDRCCTCQPDKTLSFHFMYFCRCVWLQLSSVLARKTLMSDYYFISTLFTVLLSLLAHRYFDKQPHLVVTSPVQHLIACFCPERAVSADRERETSIFTCSYVAPCLCSQTWLWDGDDEWCLFSVSLKARSCKVYMIEKSFFVPWCCTLEATLTHYRLSRHMCYYKERQAAANWLAL